MSGRAAFTLLEICLAMLIALIVTMVALPSIQGVIEDQRRRTTFDAFESLVHQAETRAITERRAYWLIWEKSAVILRPASPRTKEEKVGIARMDFGENEECAILFPASLVKDPGAFWTFWPTGTCEPARVYYKGKTGNWMADYDPLTVHGEYSTKFASTGAP